LKVLIHIFIYIFDCFYIPHIIMVKGPSWFWAPTLYGFLVPTHLLVRFLFLLSLV
jgi:hypothetical protein